jgi:hypothetical protein
MIAGLGLGLAQMVTTGDLLIFHLAFVLGLVLLLLAATAYTAVLFGTILASRAAPSVAITFILAGAIWLVLGSALEVVVGTLSQPGSAIDPAAEEPALEAILIGFLVSTGLGVSLRTLPTFAGLSATSGRLLPGILVGIQIGVTGLVLGALLAGDLGQEAIGQPIAGIGAMVLFTAVLGYLWAIRLFEPSSLPIAEMGMGQGWLRAVRFAYGWLAVALLILAEASVGTALGGQPIPWGILGAARHAIALGFVTLLILGVASRVIPVFAGKPLWKSSLVDVATGLLVASVAIRVPVEVLSPYGSSVLGDFLLTVSGPLAWFGLLVFTLNFVMTMVKREPARVEALTVPVATSRGYLRGDDLLAEALRMPEGLGVLLGLGLGYLADPGHRAIAARSLTIAQAARRADQDPEHVIDALNQSLGAAPDVASAVDPQLTVGQVLERWPETLDVFIRYGFTPLTDPYLRQRIDPTITLRTAAASRGVDVRRLLSDLQLATRVVSGAGTENG